MKAIVVTTTILCPSCGEIMEIEEYNKTVTCIKCECKDKYKKFEMPRQEIELKEAEK